MSKTKQKCRRRDLRVCRQLVADQLDIQEKNILHICTNAAIFPLNEGNLYDLDMHRHLYYAFSSLLKIIDNKLLGKEGGEA